MRARQLEMFCTLMQAGTVTAAAARLNISQPALSQMLLHAEDQLGFRLFDRVRGRLVPTQEALDLFPEAERIFAELAAFRRRTRDMRQGRTGIVRMAASAPPAMTLVPQAMAAFRAAHPDIVVRSQIAPMRHIVQMLRDGDISVGVVMNDKPHPDIRVEVIGQSCLACLLPDDHPLARRTEIGLEDLQDQTLISYRPETLPGALLASLCDAAGQDFAPSIEIDVSISALPFVQQGLGVAIVDGLLPWDQFRGVVQRPFHPRTGLPIALLTHATRPPTGAADMMRAQLLKTHPQG
ncbi:LysR family transcriptional regulator [Falsirhodobacter halotolerans]|uniref:LysR family transcriptional regulator n=1 Tax=Falsirhodobacter halotolerans TaxID=1146892 RepID=UPI001FD01A35|nr:LysR family transcriptional regulator [Falsirhodobacter halotolerans]MCJ8140971.1 LysR family transcriptional regulator [Falsirhodobacter halotolerans]